MVVVDRALAGIQMPPHLQAIAQGVGAERIEDGQGVIRAADRTVRDGKAGAPEQGIRVGRSGLETA